MLSIQNVSAGYRRRTVLHDVSMDVAKGEAVAIVGSNGAGKSTLVRTISGLIRPARGQILLEGERIDRLGPHEITGRGIAQVPEGRHIFGDFTVADNLRAGAYLRTDRDVVNQEIDEVLESVPELSRRGPIPARQLSGGEQQLLALYRALMGNPKILVLDEPSMGLAPILVERIYTHIRAQKNKGMTIVLVEQNLALALKVVDRAYVLASGEVKFEGTPDQLTGNEDVVGMYMGTGSREALAPRSQGPLPTDPVHRSS